MRRLAVAVFVTSALLLPRAAAAQAVTSGTIAGTVRDTSGAVLPGVTVEAASPALIEKVRSAVTDEQGQYKIVDLRPGTYAVTFTLTGFSTVKREGLELTTGFTAAINAEMRVGTVEETITVTGASPVVDTQNVRMQVQYSREIIDALPYSKTLTAYTSMLPGVTGGVYSVVTRDVGGTAGEANQGQSIHGGDPGLTSIDGVKNISVLTGNMRRLAPTDLYTQEVVLETSGASAEAWSGGLNFNIVMKDGGNRFSGSTYEAYTGEGLDSNNLDDKLRARGVTQYNKQKKLYDMGVAIGGPIKQDRAWFFIAPRKWGNEYYVAGNYFNKTPHTLFYTPDLSRPALFGREHWDVSGRITWQVSAKDKLTFTDLNGKQCYCPYNTESGSVSPEAAAVFWYYPQRLATLTWTRPTTQRLLIEGSVAWRDESNRSFANPDLSHPTDIPVTETTINRQYNAYFGNLGVVDYAVNPTHQWLTRGTVSYVTGSHALKVGFSTFSAVEVFQPHDNFAEAYTFTNQRPIALTQIATPLRQESRMGLALGLFAQDQWTIRRLTLNVGVRFDSIDAYAPAQTRPGGKYVPAIDFPEARDLPSWKNIHPRFGAAYDLFGDTKTALKVSVGRYELGGNFSLDLLRNNNPANSIVKSATRTWNDANGNFVPDCDLFNLGVNGECGRLSNQAFGTPVVNTVLASDMRRGWGVSPQLWQTAVSVQQELRPNVGLTAGYYRTWYLNQTLTDNLEVTPADFTSYCLPVPVDARLPGGGGYDVCGLYDVSFEKFGRVNNVVTLASNFGGRSQVYNGFDANLNARFPGGAVVRGGFSAGRTVFDNCAAADVPTQFCRNVASWGRLSDVKVSAVYPLPWWGIQTSATYQNLPGLARTATMVATNAQIAPSLGRNLSSCPAPTGACNATATVTIVEPNVLEEARGNQVDLRVSKIFDLGQRRLQANVDVFNLTNSNDVLSIQSRYSGTNGGTWLQPISIQAGRLVKFSVQFNF